MRDLLIALLLPIVESAVRLVEERYPDQAAPDKRNAALDIVEKRLAHLQEMLGPLSVKPDESIICGLIDVTAHTLHETEEFKAHKKEERHYQKEKPKPAKEKTR